MNLGKTKVPVLTWVMALGVALLSSSLVMQAIRVAMPEPLYDDFCTQELMMGSYNTKDECEKVGGQWLTGPAPWVDSVAPTEGQPAEQSYCDTTATCQQEYTDALKPYQRNLMLAVVLLGVVLIGIALSVALGEAVTLGLTFGGVLVLFQMMFGPAGYLEPDGVSVVILGAGLAALIWLGMKKLPQE